MILMVAARGSARHTRSSCSERYLSTLSNQSTMRQALFPDPPRTAAGPPSRGEGANMTAMRR